MMTTRREKEWTHCPVCGRYAAGHREQHGYVEVINRLGQARLIREEDREEDDV